MPDFKELARKRLATEQTTGVPGEEDRHYRAFRIATRNLIALSVRLMNGARLQYPYSHFCGGQYWEKGDYVQLDFGDLGLLHLWGSRLLDLEEQIGEGNIRVVEEFDPERWGTPPAGEPVIHRIEFQQVGEKAPDDLEPPPPLDAQH